ncbi:oxidoreductase [uncultured Psychroserpens sp.]|uniref:WD40/YVTN/BNR-like repeat-containing protein n=1 Tax=uncultured Psychroserpens sp. TaxID=255436 RepID=UPI002603F936|nr:oxidoreductase [uncultured Psychroserpens sp.]
MKKILRFIIVPILVLALFGFTLTNAGEKTSIAFKKQFTKVEIETVLQDSLLNIRAIELVKGLDGIAFLTSRGEFGAIGPKDAFEAVRSVGLDQSENYDIVFPIALKYDSITPNFRALSANKKHGYGISIGSPALIYKLNIDEEKIKIVYKEEHPKAFYDSMEFWNDDEGIAIGDPTEDCMSIIITRDGGNTWSKLSCDDLPKAKEGEAAFAASDTNIAIVGDQTWVATGGKSSRILYSADKGKTWSVFETPIVQGLETTGMYSVDFYDENHGFAIGGDYTKPADSSANKVRTKDGGKTWELVAENQSPGYRSCVKYVPNGAGKKLVAIGFKGIDYSGDSGDSWTHLSDEGFYTIRFLNDSIAYAAGRGRISKLTFKE